MTPEETYKETLKRIEQAAQDERQFLDLSERGLTELPPEIGNLTSLTRLNLNNNQLRELPPEIGTLTNLIKLFLRNNQLVEFPPEVGNLTKLTFLDLDDNQLRELPPEIGNLTNLTRLDLRDNQLRELPPEIGNLTSLTDLYLNQSQLMQLSAEMLTYSDLRRNQLTELPPEIGNLTNLTILNLDNNQLRELPPEIGNLTNLTDLHLNQNQLRQLPPQMGNLTKLEILGLQYNPLKSPPPSIVEQGTIAVLVYFREWLEESKRQWISKMLIVGEGGVGKTSLLRAIRGEEFVEGLETTHGIQIDSLELEHPTEPDVTMELNCWDFGGQEIYHATHQFFLTDRSLFVLVWNARHGFEQGKLYYWLDAIQSRAPESPVLIVAAWTDERDADLPLVELREKYPRIVGHYEISNKTGRGIEELMTALTDTANDLPLMGEEWPADWLRAAETLRAKEEKHITPTAMREIMSNHNVAEKNQHILALWLHELGDILYFQDDELLNDLVILKPQWVTEYISKVLESKAVIGRSGIFTSQHMKQIWGDLASGMQDHFLRMMEKFDLSYRTLEDREISLVVERLPLDAPNYSELWDGTKEREPCREVSMTFKLNTIPAGIPTWFIARSHRFTTHTHWRTGAVFADSEEQRHLALVQARPHDKYIHLNVRGPTPSNFFALMKDGIEVTLNRFPGLKIERLVPCPGHDGNSCAHEFDYVDLEKAIEMEPPIQQLQCPKSFELVSVAKLLFGLHLSTQDAVLQRINELEAGTEEKQEQILTELAALRELSQREFTNIFRRDQAVVDSHCPNVFVLRPRAMNRWKKFLVGQKIDMQLYCQAPGEWHPTADGGHYEIDDSARWIRAAGPYIEKMVNVMKYAAPLVAPALGVAMPGIAKIIGDDIKLMTELVKKLPDLEEDPTLELAEMAGETRQPEEATGASLRAIRALLDKKDPTRQWGGLKKVLTPEGHYLWLCEHHAKEYRT